MNSSNHNEPTKEQLLSLYIDKNMSKAQIRKLLNIGNKKLTQLFKLYNIHKSEEIVNQNISRKLMGHPSTSKKKYIAPDNTIKRMYQDQKMTISEIADTMGASNGSIKRRLDSMGIEKSHKEKLKDMKFRSRKKYGVDHVSQTEEWQRKHLETMKLNHSFNISKPEEQAYNMLVKRFGKKNVLRQYRSDLYPFNCDFYIKSLDLYIECQFHWTHGKEPFCIWKYEHIRQLKEWRFSTGFQLQESHYYEQAIHTWTIRDPLKRETARKNKLRWVEFFTLVELQNWLNS